MSQAVTQANVEKGGVCVCAARKHSFMYVIVHYYYIFVDQLIARKSPIGILIFF